MVINCIKIDAEIYGIIPNAKIDAFENEKQRNRNIGNFSSGYLALGYLILIGFICVMGGSLIKLAEVLT